MRSLLFLFLILTFSSLSAQGPVPEAPLSDEGDGPHTQLIIRGATLINSTGAPPIGPVDIVIENDVITNIQTVGFPGVEINQDRRPKLKANGKEIDAHGQYVLPGFVDMHGHIVDGKAQVESMSLNCGWHMALQPFVIQVVGTA